MGAFDFLPRNYWLDKVLLPLGAFAICALIGYLVAKRMRAAADSGRFSEESFVGVLVRSIGNLPLFWGGLVGLDWAVHITDVSDFAEYIASCFLFTVAVWTAATFLQRTICKVLERHMDSSGSQHSTSLLLNLVSAMIYLLGVILVLDAYDVSITPLLTALGVGGMAVALGLKETMENIFAGLHILLTKQIRIGDHIRLEGGAEGQITDITWRFAKIHTVTNNIIIVPNNKLAASIITNYDMGETTGVSVEDVAFAVTVGVAYDSDLDKVERITLEVARDVLARFDPALNTADGASTAPSVRFHTFGDSSIDFNVNLHTTSFRNQYLIRHEFIKALKKRYEEENIQIPFPVRTLQMGPGKSFPQ